MNNTINVEPTLSWNSVCPRQKRNLTWEALGKKILELVGPVSGVLVSDCNWDLFCEDSLSLQVVETMSVVQLLDGNQVVCVQGRHL